MFAFFAALLLAAGGIAGLQERWPLAVVLAGLGLLLWWRTRPRRTLARRFEGRSRIGSARRHSGFHSSLGFSVSGLGGHEGYGSGGYEGGSVGAGDGGAWGGGADSGSSADSGGSDGGSSSSD
ncbi:hypothetical protein OOT46_02115 [Aquabacterium sp. A7-Y]|uniref:hypothetical protein n=1 Tax=Aquabacterium sp. A7-Y TaxID=1349605 RepID=UPI00223E8421|nr:hypothetical protein [Aquabacterium sp. A7-Y]MCW7536652.1 hypothetical protein [Aquabacterium sp. A7-Y]